MSFSRTSRPAAQAIPLPLVLVLAGLTAAGCMDKVPAPTLSPVHVVFHTDVAGLTNGAKLWIDGELKVDSLTTDHLDLLLSGGAHTFVLHKDCVEVTPGDTLRVDLHSGRSEQVDFHMVQEAGLLTVTSDPPGLPVWLDGRPSGQVTPAAFPCLEQGAHVVHIPSSALEQVGFSVSGDTTRTAQVGVTGTTALSFPFSYTPLLQSRGVLLELFTATYCPNCPPADHAADSLEFADPSFQPEQLACVQVHLRWGGTDPFYNDMIGDRITFYGNDQSAPYAWFNGGDKISGSNIPDIFGTYKARVMNTYGTPGHVALYWRNARVEGSTLLADLRCVVLDDLSGYASPQLNAFFAKDSLTAQNPFHVPSFSGVVRAYFSAVDLASAGITAPGKYIDVPVSFDLSGDALNVASSLRLVAFVQDVATREILQCRETKLKSP